MAIEIKIKRLESATGLPLPSYQTAHAAGMDLVASEAAVLKPGERALVSTGLVLEIPEGFEAQIRPRSGLALKYGVTLVNSPGTIDADYRGEIRVLLINHGTEPFAIERGERIAQIVFAPVTRIEWGETDEVTGTGRGGGGFGSTGR